MAKNLAALVTKENVIKAFEKTISENLTLNPSTRFDIVYNQISFPPKEIVRLAARLQGIDNIDHYRLSGGESTNRHLRNMGFEVVKKENSTNAQMTPVDFVNHLKEYLNGINISEQFGNYNYAGINNNISFGTPGGAWDAKDFPGYSFTNGKKSYLLRLVVLENSTYIVFEAIHINSQLLNFNLVTGQTFVNDGGLITITENYLMTIGGRVAAAKVKQAMITAGFNDDNIITTAEEDDFQSKQIILDLIEWAQMRERAKELIKNNLPLVAENTITITPEPVNVKPLNTILYGPPGTGKTYNTIQRAAEIVTGESFTNRYDEAKKLYKEKFGTQVEFITFHQNYSYEDFVAGLRPDVTADTNGLKFKEHRGIFYKLCERAKKNFADYQQYKAGKQFKDPSFEDVLNEFLKPLQENDEPIQLSTIARTKSFKIDSVNAKNLGFEKQSGSREHTLSINTIKALYEGNREYNLQGLGVYMYPVVDRLKQIAATLKTPVTAVSLKNYVLIIDEINRANISRVFGELITLLEPDKRIGAKHELQLHLPGLPDDEAFAVPPNLYIIGTMNTADKSIALLDIALRRRFHFEPMYPDDELDGVQYPAILKKINEAVLAKKGADFLIGHAYFMPDENGNFDLVDSLKHKVIPLLNEYFYNQKGDTVKSIIEAAIADQPNMKIEKDQYGQLQFSAS